MKKFFAIVAAVFTLVAPTATEAEEGFYAGAMGGVNFLDAKHTKVNTGWTVGVVGGYEMCNDFSVEAEVSYRGNNPKHNHSSSTTTTRSSSSSNHNFRTWSFMGNLYYDIDMCWCVKPYVGVGIGYDDVHGGNHSGSSSSSSVHHKDSGFAYQVMVGAAYELCNELDLTLEYKFHDTRHGNYNNAITLGVKKFFGCFDSCCF